MIDDVLYRLSTDKGEGVLDSLPLRLHRAKLTLLNQDDFCDDVILTVTMLHPSEDKSKSIKVDFADKLDKILWFPLRMGFLHQDGSHHLIFSVRKRYFTEKAISIEERINNAEEKALSAVQRAIAAENRLNDAEERARNAEGSANTASERASTAI